MPKEFDHNRLSQVISDAETNASRLKILSKRGVPVQAECDQEIATLEAALANARGHVTTYILDILQAELMNFQALRTASPREGANGPIDDKSEAV